MRDRHIQSLQGAGVRPEAIEELVLTRCRLKPDSWQAIGQFQQLKWLDLSNSNATPEDLRWLKNFNRLERLSLEALRIDRELLATAARLPELTELDLSLCEVNDDLLEALKPCSKLETLWLSGTGVTKSSLSWLERMPKLKFVALDQTSISAEDSAAFAERLKSK